MSADASLAFVANNEPGQSSLLGGSDGLEQIYWLLVMSGVELSRGVEEERGVRDSLM